MTTTPLRKRSEIPVEHTWDTASIFLDLDAFSIVGSSPDCRGAPGRSGCWASGKNSVMSGARSLRYG